MRGFYTSTAIYTQQLRALEDFARQNPDDAASRFVLAYHYMSGGYQEDAARKLNEVVQLMPKDHVAAELLKMSQAKPADSGNAPQPQPPETAAIQPGQVQPQVQPGQVPPAPTRPAPTGPAIDAATLIGTWNAKRDDGAAFTLVLNQDNTFSWKFSQPDGNQKDNTQQFSGKYTLEGDLLALERQEGGSLVAQVTQDKSGNFNFKLLGAPQQDPGLDFQK